MTWARFLQPHDDAATGQGWPTPTYRQAIRPDWPQLCRWQRQGSAAGVRGSQHSQIKIAPIVGCSNNPEITRIGLERTLPTTWNRHHARTRGIQHTVPSITTIILSSDHPKITAVCLKNALTAPVGQGRKAGTCPGLHH